MREIKFKVFNTRLKKMSKPFSLESLLSCEVALLHDSLIADEIIWIEFTGLKGKNGKEIYEGDIIRVDDPGGWRDIIIFRDGKFTGKKWNIPSLLKTEVIGNIWETEELLK